MTDPLQRALDAIADGTELDWAALEADTPEQSRPALRNLREIASIARAHAVPAPRLSQSTPFEWGFLHVEEYVASGAHGDVYRAWDPHLERRVALKLLRYDAPGDDRASLAITEGRLLARIRHPNVVTVYGADRIDGLAGIWMELIEGRTLRETVELQGPLPVADAGPIGLAICDSLAAVHAAGLVHRDVKAQNVMRDAAGRLVLMDFGGGREDRQPDGRFEGTPVYLAPELLNGAPASAASDIYALGVLLFFIVTGRYPVAAASIDDLRAEHESGRRERLADVRTLPASFSAAVDRALSRNPEDRFASAAEMRRTIETVRPPTRVNWMVPTLMTAAALASAAIASTTWQSNSGSPPVTTGVPAAAAPAPAAIAGRGNIDPHAPSAPPPQSEPVPAMAQTTNESRPVKLRVPPHVTGVPSHDGHVIPYVDWNGDLWIWETESGVSHRLTKDGSSTESARGTLASPRGDRVAYGWALAGEAYELRLIEATGRWPQTVIGRQKEYEPIPVDWSRDGLTILCWLRQQNGTADLALVPVDGGPAHVLSTFQAADVTSPDHGLVTAGLSPDGRFVVTTRRTTSRPDRYDVIILATDGSEPRTLIGEVSDDAYPAWTADGKQIVFVRDSPEFPATSRDVWVVRSTGGIVQEKAVVVAPNIGSPNRVALTDEGTLYVLTSTGSTEVYTASIDLTGGTPPGASSRISRKEIGNHAGPSWSPDGRSIAYFTTKPRPFPGSTPLRTLTIRDVQSDRTHTVKPLGFQGAFSPRWFPDSQSVAVWGGADFDVQVGYYRVDVKTGQTSDLLLFAEDRVPANPGFFQITVDGRELLYGDARRGIVSYNLESGFETVVVAKGTHTRILRFNTSPDGQSIAFAAEVDDHNQKVTTIEIETGGGPPKELIRAVYPERLDLHAFTPDGQSLIFGRSGFPNELRLWWIPAAGGEAHDMHVVIRSLPNPISVSPDGRRIAYPARTMRQDLHVLPLALGAQQAARQH